MNKTKFAFTLSAAIAVGLVASSFAEQKLSASVSGSTATYVGGSWDTGTGITAPTCEDGYFVFDNDETCSNRFTATSAIASGKSATCEFDLLAASVPASVRLTPDSGAKTAFCIVTNTTDGGASKFCAWVKDTDNKWVDLTGFDAPTDGTAYKLKVEFVFTNTVRRVRFSVKTTADTYTALTAGSGMTDGWFTAANTDNKLNAYDFIGEGKVASFTADEYAEAAAEVIVDGKKVVIPESTKSAVDTAASTAGMDAQTYLNSTAKGQSSTISNASKLENSLSVADNLAIGLVVKSDDGLAAAGTGDDTGKLIVEKRSQTKDTTKISLGFKGITKGDTNATVTYKLQGSNDNSTWADVASSTSDVPAIPLTGTGVTVYKYYKVNTSVTYPSK